MLTPIAVMFVTTAIAIGISIVELPFVARTLIQYVPTVAVTFVAVSKPPVVSVIPAGSEPDPGESAYVMPDVEPVASAAST